MGNYSRIRIEPVDSIPDPHKYHPFFDKDETLEIVNQELRLLVQEDYPDAEVVVAHDELKYDDYIEVCDLKYIEEAIIEADFTISDHIHYEMTG